MSPDETFAAYQAAIAAHDLRKTMELIADDAVYLFSNETHHVGKAAVRTAIEMNFHSIRNETYEVRGLRWLVDTDDAATCIYEFHWSGEIKGTKMSGNGRGTNVLRREADGSWKVVLEHLSKGGLGLAE